MDLIPFDPDAPAPPTRADLIWRGVLTGLAVLVVCTVAVLYLACRWSNQIWLYPALAGVIGIGLALLAAVFYWPEPAYHGVNASLAIGFLCWILIDVVLRRWSDVDLRNDARSFVLCAGLLALAVTCFKPKEMWRVCKVTLVTGFVCWHLFFLMWRNPSDLWWKDFQKWGKKQDWWKEVEPGVKKYFEPTDALTKGYGRSLGIGQGWSMFTPNMARGANFVTARIEFDSGADAILRSPNEPHWESDENPHSPPKPKAFFRLGGWRQRKLEDELAWLEEKDLPGEDDLPLLQAYVRWSIRRWQADHANDERKPVRVILFRRRISFPDLDRSAHDPESYVLKQPTKGKDPDNQIIGYFNADGSLP